MSKESPFGAQGKSYCPCADPKVKAMVARENALMALGGAMNPFTIMTLAQFAANTKQRYHRITIEAWDLPPGWYSDQLTLYGIPHDLIDIQIDCRSGVGLFKRSTYAIPHRQVWMADRTLRALAVNQGGFEVVSPPIYDRGRGSSLDSGQTGKIWKPWGVPAKSKSFGMSVSRGIGRMVGNTDERAYNRLMMCRELSQQRAGEYEEFLKEEQKMAGHTPGRQKRAPSRFSGSHRHITVERKRKRKKKKKRGSVQGKLSRFLGV